MSDMRSEVKVIGWDDIEDMDAFFESGGEMGYGGTMQVVGKGFITREKHYPHAGHQNVVSAASAASLAQAMRTVSERYGEDVRIFIAKDDGYSASRSGAHWNTHFHLALDEDRLVAKVGVSLPDASTSDVRLDLIIREFASQADLAILKMNTYLGEDGTSLGYDDWADSDGRHETDPLPDARADFERAIREGFGANRDVGVVVCLPDGQDDVGRLVAGVTSLAALISTTGGAAATVDAVRTWIRAGRFELLEGLRESSWLEIKSAPYRLSAPGDTGTKQKIELAQDVARFANGGLDAVLLIGFPEVLRDDVSVVGEVRPVPLELIDAEQIRSVLDARVIPLLSGLAVEVVLVSADAGVVMISVPPQPAELYPYLVSGAVVGDKVEGAFFSVVQRRGEGSAVIDAAQIHTYLVAGRAFLRSGLNSDG